MIARNVGVGTSTVYRTKRHFVEDGLEHALNEAPRPGQPRKLSAGDESLLIALACSSPPEGRARWSLDLLADEMVRLTVLETLSGDTVGRRLSELALKPWLQKMWCVPKIDGEYVARMEDILELYDEAPDPLRPVVCFDETPRQLIGEARVPVRAEPGKPARIDYEYVRNGTANVFMFVDVIRPWRHAKVTDQRTCENVTLGEAAQAYLGVETSATDGATLGETVNVEVVGGAEFEINKSEGVTAGESLAVSLPDALLVDKSEGVTIGEAVSASLADPLAISKSEGVTLGEAISASLPDALLVDKSEGVTLGEAVSASLPDSLAVNVADGVTLGEAQTVGIETAPTLSISASDGVTISDGSFFGFEDLEIAKSEGVTVGETVADSLPTALAISISEGVTLGEAAAADITISISRATISRWANP